MEISPHEYDGPWILKEGFALAAGDQEFVSLVRYQEAREFQKNPDYGATFMEVFATKNAPLPAADKKHIFTLRATAIESAYCDLQCQVWIENGRLRIAPLAPEQRQEIAVSVKAAFQTELPAVFYRGQWRHKILAHVPFFNEKAKKRLRWIATWERDRSEISLLEAATRAYEITRKMPAGQHASILAESDTDILTWYCNAMTMPRSGRPPLVALEGVHPPARVSEPIDPSTLTKFDFAFEDHDLILKERSGRSRINSLRVGVKDAEAAIAEISSWGGLHAANL
jgi:hypothetical protein